MHSRSQKCVEILRALPPKEKPPSQPRTLLAHEPCSGTLWTTPVLQYLTHARSDDMFLPPSQVHFATLSAPAPECVHACVCVFVCVCACVHVCMYVCMHACMHVCMYACMHVCVCVCVCVYVCARYIYIYIRLFPTVSYIARARAHTHTHTHHVHT